MCVCVCVCVCLFVCVVCVCGVCVCVCVYIFWDQVHAGASVERELQGRLDQRKFEERCYCLLLEYLATLPALDKDGQAMSVGALKDLLKMQRRQANQLATHRIQVPSALWRPART